MLISKSELQQLTRKKKDLEEKLTEAKKRLSVFSKGSWGGSAAKDQAQQDVYLYTAISPNSPLGRVLVDSKKGDRVQYETPEGTKKVKILEIKKAQA